MSAVATSDVPTLGAWLDEAAAELPRLGLAEALETPL